VFINISYSINKFTRSVALVFIEHHGDIKFIYGTVLLLFFAINQPKLREIWRIEIIYVVSGCQRQEAEAKPTGRTK